MVLMNITMKVKKCFTESIKKKERDSKRNDEVKPCVCGHNRWKTLHKNVEYRCRNCNQIRNVEPE